MREGKAVKCSGGSNMADHAERLCGKREVWIQNIERGLGVLTQEWGHVSMGGGMESNFASECLEAGETVYGDSMAGHLIELRLDGDFLECRHVAKMCAEFGDEADHDVPEPCERFQ